MATEAPPPAVEPLPCRFYILRPVDYADEACYHQHDVWRWVSATGQALILKEEQSDWRGAAPAAAAGPGGGGGQ